MTAVVLGKRTHDALTPAVVAPSPLARASTPSATTPLLATTSAPAPGIPAIVSPLATSNSSSSSSSSSLDRPQSDDDAHDEALRRSIAGRLPAAVMTRRRPTPIKPLAIPLSSAGSRSALPFPTLPSSAPPTPTSSDVPSDDEDSDCYEVPSLPEDSCKPIAKRQRPNETSPNARVEFRAITVLRQSVNVCIYRSHDVARIKQLLAPVTGIPVDKMAVVFNGNVLLDHVTVAEAGIQNSSILLVRPPHSQPTISLCVRTLAGPLTQFVVCPKTTVGDLKARIQAKEQLPVERQTLLFNKTPMLDAEPLSRYINDSTASLLLLPRFA